MQVLFDRVRDSLAPHYQVEAVLGIGGMATVFLARDPSLDRAVAIKVLQPEIATAAAAERFVREARLLAKLHHPNVVPIHQVGEAVGLFYYVMEHIEGPTLEQGLETGPLQCDRAVSLGQDILSALQAAHAAGVIHRDVKPGNIFLLAGRAILADFGISTSGVGLSDRLTRTGQRLGTPGYMPPELAVGGDVSVRTDLYAVGMVLYEALTGRPWSILETPERADWTGVPRRLRDVLGRALALAPEKRWPDAVAFRRALRKAGTSRFSAPATRVTLLTVGVAVAIAAAFIWLRPSASESGLGGSPSTPQISGLAIQLPFRSSGPADTALARQIARLAYLNLEGRPWLAIEPTDYGYCQPELARPEDAPALVASMRRTRSRYVAEGTVLQGRADTVEIRLSVQDVHSGRSTEDIVRGSNADPVRLGDAVALALARMVLRGQAFPYRKLKGLEGRAFPTVRQFLLGEQFLRCNDRVNAEFHLSEAVRMDSTFALAKWHLAIARRWMQRPPGIDLVSLYESASSDLSPLDSLLLGAEVEPSLSKRLARYAAITRAYPHSGMAAFLYGDELFHRGPLVGVALDSAAVVLERAARLDSLLALAFDHLAWIWIRTGRRAEARRTLDHLIAISAPREDETDYSAFLEQAFRERFEPEISAQARREMFDPSTGEGAANLAFATRWGLSFGLPRVELELGTLLASVAGADDDERAAAMIARGLSLMALGAPSPALVWFDSAAELLDSAAERVTAAQWRVVPPALGLYALPAAEIERGRRRLRAMLRTAGDSTEEQVRALWTLVLDGRTASGDSRREEGEGGGVGTPGREGTDRFGAWAEAVRLAARGEFEAALRRSASLVAFDSAGRTRRPFERSAAHLIRAEWLDSAGRPLEADRSRLWYEGNDIFIDRILSGLTQAGEVDWALGPYASLLRARAALKRGDPREACRHLKTLLTVYWTTPAETGGAPRGDAVRLSSDECAS